METEIHMKLSCRKQKPSQRIALKKSGQHCKEYLKL